MKKFYNRNAQIIAIVNFCENNLLREKELDDQRIAREIATDNFTVNTE